MTDHLRRAHIMKCVNARSRFKLDSPVIILEALDKRKQAVTATSFGLKIRPMGQLLSAFSVQLSPLLRLCMACSLSVTVQPILMALTRMPLGANSAALFLVKITKAA